MQQSMNKKNFNKTHKKKQKHSFPYFYWSVIQFRLAKALLTWETPSGTTAVSLSLLAGASGGYAVKGLAAVPRKMHGISHCSHLLSSG